MDGQSDGVHFFWHSRDCRYPPWYDGGLEQVIPVKEVRSKAWKIIANEIACSLPASWTPYRQENRHLFCKHINTSAVSDKDQSASCVGHEPAWSVLCNCRRRRKKPKVHWLCGVLMARGGTILNKSGREVQLIIAAHPLLKCLMSVIKKQFHCRLLWSLLMQRDWFATKD
jgi:hypothetical protein